MILSNEEPDDNIQAHLVAATHAPTSTLRQPALHALCTTRWNLAKMGFISTSFCSWMLGNNGEDCDCKDYYRCDALPSGDLESEKQALIDADLLIAVMVTERSELVATTRGNATLLGLPQIVVVKSGITLSEISANRIEDNTVVLSFESIQQIPDLVVKYLEEHKEELLKTKRSRQLVKRALRRASIGERIRKHRAEKGASQSWLASRIGITSEQMRNIENGSEPHIWYLSYFQLKALDLAIEVPLYLMLSPDINDAVLKLISRVADEDDWSFREAKNFLVGTTEYTMRQIAQGSVKDARARIRRLKSEYDRMSLRDINDADNPSEL